MGSKILCQHFFLEKQLVKTRTLLMPTSNWATFLRLGKKRKFYASINQEKTKNYLRAETN